MQREDEYADRPTLKISAIISGEPAYWYHEWREMGLVKSVPDAIIQSFALFNEKVLDERMKRLQLQASKEERPKTPNSGRTRS
jgi:hypothetical protein